MKNISTNGNKSESKERNVSKKESTKVVLAETKESFDHSATHPADQTDPGAEETTVVLPL